MCVPCWCSNLAWRDTPPALSEAVTAHLQNSTVNMSSLIMEDLGRVATDVIQEGVTSGIWNCHLIIIFIDIYISNGPVTYTEL